MNEVNAYLETLETKGSEAAKEYVTTTFGIEGEEGFKADEFETFSNAVIAEVMERNVAAAADEATAADVVEEPVEEVTTDATES